MQSQGCLLDMIFYFSSVYAIPAFSMLLANGFSLVQLLKINIQQTNLNKSNAHIACAAKIISAISTCFLLLETIPHALIFAQMLQVYKKRRNFWKDTCAVMRWTNHGDSYTSTVVLSRKQAATRYIMEGVVVVSLLNCICLDQVIYFVFSKEYRKKLLSLPRMFIPTKRVHSEILQSSQRVPSSISRVTFTAADEAISLDVRNNSETDANDILLQACVQPNDGD